MTLTATIALMSLGVCPHRLAGNPDAPVWEQYQRIGVQAFNEGRYVEAIENLSKAISRAKQIKDVNGTDEVADMQTQVGTAYMALANDPREKKTRRSRIEGAARAFESAIRMYANSHAEDALVMADAWDRYAQSREQLAFADTQADFSRLYNRYCGIVFSGGKVHDLYLKALMIREKNLGEAHPEVMLYRRSLYRKLYAFAAELRRKGQESSSLDIRHKAKAIVESLMELADELKATDRRLSKDQVATQPAMTP